MNGNTTEFAQGSDNNTATATASVTRFDIAGQSLAMEIIASVGIPICMVGCLANAAVLAVLVRARRQAKGNVLTLIINQSTMDLVACAFVTVIFIVTLTHRSKYNGTNQVADDVICVMFESALFATVSMTAGKLGLVVITLERYFKIVHAVAHRKYYRNWMTKLGVSLPWVSGVCLILLPGVGGATRVVNGRCLRNSIWPTEAMAKTYTVVRFLFHYPIPVATFAYCYSRIFHVIRRQSKVFSGQAGRGQDVAMANIQRDQGGTGQAQKHAVGATTGAKLSHTEINILQTMVAVIVCYMAFWTAPSVANILPLIGVVAVQRNTFILLGSIGYISMAINPFIYAARYEVFNFRRTVKEMMNKSRGPSNRTNGGAAAAK